MITELDESVDTLNSLLRSEHAAIESYEYALPRFENESCERALNVYCDEHREAAMLLRERVVDFGGEPWVGSSPWGLFTAMTGAASVVADSATLSALRRTEERGARKFEDAVADELLSAECQALIAGHLLPQTHCRIEGLGRLIDLCQ
jgi:hypothetical protein